jgi:hypothetical protein
VLALLSNTVSARREPEKAMNALQRVVSSADVLKGRRGEAQELSQRLLDRLEGKKS